MRVVNDLVNATPRRSQKKLEAPPGFEPGMEVLQTSALPLGDGADMKCSCDSSAGLFGCPSTRLWVRLPFDSRFSAFRCESLAQDTLHVSGLPRASLAAAARQAQGESSGAGNGIRTRDFDLGKVALYH